WKNGIPNEQYMTSADYERLSASQFGLADEAAQLRGVYLPVRYGEKAVTQADILFAKKIYKRIKAFR
ncbi:MAG: hypothetical protein FWD03_10430, partial [Defluviitaleaceae bacterium]|nr:hypothetical protein [Defluviitaleaceae bacterium]